MTAITAQAQGYTRRDKRSGAPVSGTCIVTIHNWSLGASDIIDFRAQLAGFRLGFISACYVDNSQNVSALRIQIPAPGYFIDIPAGYCGYFPVFMLSLQAVTVINVSGSTGSTEIVWLDVDVEPAVWSGGQGNLSAIPVMDSALEGSLRTQADQNTSLRVTLENNGADAGSNAPYPVNQAAVTYTTNLGPIVVAVASGLVLAGGSAPKSLVLFNNAAFGGGTAWLNPAGGAAVVGAGIKIPPQGAYAWNTGVTATINGISDNGNISLSGACG